MLWKRGDDLDFDNYLMSNGIIDEYYYIDNEEGRDELLYNVQNNFHEKNVREIKEHLGEYNFNILSKRFKITNGYLEDTSEIRRLISSQKRHKDKYIIDNFSIKRYGITNIQKVWYTEEIRDYIAGGEIYQDSRCEYWLIFNGKVLHWHEREY